MTRVVLASASAGRRRVLRGAGIDPLVIVSGVDEDAIVSALPSGATPPTVTTALAVAKAEAVVPALDAGVRADCLVIGCDSMLFHNGGLVGKPGSALATLRQWKQLAGTTGQLHTGHCLIRMENGVSVQQFSECSRTTVTFGTPSNSELDAYVLSGEPLHVAGGFTLDGLGGWFVEAVDGDPSTVIGIGLPLTRRLLRRAGLSLPELWKANPLQ